MGLLFLPIKLRCCGKKESRTSRCVGRACQTNNPDILVELLALLYAHSIMFRDLRALYDQTNSRARSFDFLPFWYRQAESRSLLTCANAQIETLAEMTIYYPCKDVHHIANTLTEARDIAGFSCCRKALAHMVQTLRKGVALAKHSSEELEGVSRASKQQFGIIYDGLGRYKSKRRG